MSRGAHRRLYFITFERAPHHLDTCTCHLCSTAAATPQGLAAPRDCAEAAHCCCCRGGAPLTQEQWCDFKSKERKSQRAQRWLDECVALLREAKLAHFAPLRAARRPSGSSCSGRGLARRRRAGRRVAGFVVMAL